MHGKGSQKIMKKSIVKQLMFQMFFILIIPELLVGFFYYYSYRSALYRDAQQKLQEYVNRGKTAAEENIGYVLGAVENLVYNQEFLYFLNWYSSPREREAAYFLQGLQEEWIGIRHTYPNLFEKLKIYSTNPVVQSENNWKMEVICTEELPDAGQEMASDLWYGPVTSMEYGRQENHFFVEEPHLLIWPLYRSIRDFRTGEVIGVIELDVSFANMIQAGNLRKEAEIRIEYTAEDGTLLFQTKPLDTDEKYLSFSDTVPSAGITLGSMIAVNKVTETARKMIWKVGLVALSGILLMMILTYLIIRSSLRRLIVMDEAMEQVEAGNFGIHMPDDGYDDEISRTKRRFGLMTERLDRAVNRIVEEEKAKRDAQLQALQAQINPHFLFNILETMHMQCEIDRYYKVGNGLSALGGLMHYSMKWEGYEVPFKAEWTQLTNYLSLMQLRMDDDLTLDLACDSSLYDITVPKMFLQPVVENSFSHGFKGVPAPWYLSIHATREEGQMVIRIRDNGCGIEPERLEQLQKRMKERRAEEPAERERTSIGLSNVLQRMDMICEEGSDIYLCNGKDGGIEIDIRILLSDQ